MRRAGYPKSRIASFFMSKNSLPLYAENQKMIIRFNNKKIFLYGKFRFK
jgi:hypothetical protein